MGRGGNGMEGFERELRRGERVRIRREPLIRYKSSKIASQMVAQFHLQVAMRDLQEVHAHLLKKHNSRGGIEFSIYKIELATNYWQLKWCEIPGHITKAGDQWYKVRQAQIDLAVYCRGLDDGLSGGFQCTLVGCSDVVEHYGHDIQVQKLIL